MTTNVTAQSDELLTIRDVSKRLNCARQSAYRLVWSGKLPSVLLSKGMRRVRPEDLESFISAKQSQ